MDSTHNRWLVLIAMTGALSMTLLDQTVVTVALPAMTRDLDVSAAGAQWVVNAYVVAVAALVALGGKLGDRWGGVTTFRIGVAVFFLASMACGLAPTGHLGEAWMIAARALQGAGAALMTPVSAAIVVGAFGVSERGRAMAIYAGIGQVFLAVGPLVGGVLTELVSWRTVFWLNVPVGVAALVMVHVARPDDVRQPGIHVSGPSVARLVVGVLALVTGVQQGAMWGWTSSTTLLTMFVGASVTAWFVVTELRLEDPLVDVRLFARRGLLGDLVVLGLVQFGLLAVTLYSSVYFQNLLGLSPMACGFAVLPLILALAAAAQVGGRWYDRAGVRPPVLAGLLLCVLGLGQWTAVLQRLEYGVQVPGMLVTGFGIGLLMSPANTDALGRVSARERSGASGVVQTVRQLGGTLGVALIGAVVLAASPHGIDAADAHGSARAITMGFLGAVAAFALALVAGSLLLARERLATIEDEPLEAALAA